MATEIIAQVRRVISTDSGGSRVVHYALSDSEEDYMNDDEDLHGLTSGEEFFTKNKNDADIEFQSIFKK